MRHPSGSFRLHLWPGVLLHNLALRLRWMCCVHGAAVSHALMTIRCNIWHTMGKAVDRKPPYLVLLMRKRAVWVVTDSGPQQGSARLGSSQVGYWLDFVFSMCKGARCTSSAHATSIKTANLCLLAHHLETPHDACALLSQPRMRGIPDV